MTSTFSKIRTRAEARDYMSDGSREIHLHLL
jgi:hypothetical protein